MSDEGDFLSDGDQGEYNENGRNTAASRYTATGNEADIEDNVLPPFTPTQIALSEKLRIKPPECSPTTPCRLASAREEFMKNIKLGPPSTAERLTYRPKSAIETITDTIERPEGAVPPLALPYWHSLPLDNKIPGIRSPAGLLYYSPGKLSTQLHRKTKGFHLTDPYNRERVPGSPYTALHDPHAKEYINKPETKRLLYNQGLINENNEVMYTLREFNKYRDYLRTVYSDDVHENVHGADELWKHEQEQLRSIRHYLSQTEGKEADMQRKLSQKRDRAERTRQFMNSTYLYKQKQADARLAVFARQREQMKAEKILRNSEKSRLQKEKLKLLMEDQERAVLQTYEHTILKTLRSIEKKNHDALMTKKAQENHLLEWLESKINQSRERIDRYNRVDFCRRETLRINAAKRQRRIEMRRKTIAVAIVKRKAEESRRWELAKKYLYIWLNKVRKHLSASFQDSAHESCWIRGIASTLAETVKYLRFQTDTHERLDTFILNIIRLKNDIKKQLEVEEAQEEQGDKTDELAKEHLLLLLQNE